MSCENTSKQGDEASLQGENFFILNFIEIKLKFLSKLRCVQTQTLVTSRKHRKVKNTRKLNTKLTIKTTQLQSFHVNFK